MTKTPKKRRREAKTDYKARFSMLKSNKPRLVVRISNKYITAQIVESKIAQDKVLFRISSNELLNHGWPKEKAGSLKSIQAAYLTGFLFAKKTKEKDVIVDTGLYRTISGSRIFALLRGAIEGGLSIKCNKEILPSDERLNSNEKLKSLLEIKGKL